MMTKRRVLRAVSLLAAVFVLSGCVDQSKAERLLIKALQEKYDEEFIVLDSIVTSANWLNAGDLHAVCCPKSNDKLFFETSSSTETGKINWDKYMSAIVREEAYAEMEELLSQYYTDFFLDVKIYTNNASQKIFSRSDASILKFEELYKNKMRLSFYIIFNKNNMKQYNDVREIFEKYSDKFDNAQVNFWCYYSDNNTISELRSEKEKDIWGNFNLRFKTNRSEVPEYLYCRENGIFSLYWIYDAEGLRKYDVNGNEIIESEE